MSNMLFPQGIQGVNFGMLLERFEWFDDFDLSKFEVQLSLAPQAEAGGRSGSEFSNPVVFV